MGGIYTNLFFEIVNVKISEDSLKISEGIIKLISRVDLVCGNIFSQSTTPFLTGSIDLSGDVVKKIS